MRIYQRAIVEQVLKGGTFRCHLQITRSHAINAYLCGNMRRNRIVLCAGDEVTVELSPYDLRQGRVIWRQTPLNMQSRYIHQIRTASILQTRVSTNHLLPVHL